MKRLSVDDRGRVVYRYRQPFRDGSTHVVLEPLDFTETRSPGAQAAIESNAVSRGIWTKLQASLKDCAAPLDGRVDDHKPLAPVS